MPRPRPSLPPVTTLHLVDSGFVFPIELVRPDNAPARFPSGRMSLACCMSGHESQDTDSYNAPCHARNRGHVDAPGEYEASTKGFRHDVEQPASQRHAWKFHVDQLASGDVIFVENNHSASGIQ